MKMAKVLAGAILVSLACAGTGQAGIVGLTNTGVDVGPHDIDLKWGILGGKSSPQHGVFAYTDTIPDQFPFSYWAVTTPTSNWDTPFNPLNSNTDPTKNGAYDYVTAFFVTGNLSADNYVSGRFLADNEVASIYLNGKLVYTGPPASDLVTQDSSWVPFTATDDLKKGLNVFTFDVVNYAQNGGNPSGLNVQFTASAVPEPATWAMMLLGFAGLGFAGYSRTSRKPAIPTVA
jgi:hypothetical protein